MSCFICGVDAQLSVGPDSEEYQCPECGHYRISKEAIELFRLQRWKFDIYLVRRWIADQQGSGATPFIASDLAVRLMGF